MEDDLKRTKKWKMTSKKIKKWKTTSKKPEGSLLAYIQSTKINLIGCDTIVNSPSMELKTLF